MSWIVVDVESDGPAPPDYSMIQLGAVKVADLRQTFYAELRPGVGTRFDPEALAVVGVSREQTLDYPPAIAGMQRFRSWIREVNDHGRPIFVSDNPAYDFQWVNVYFWRLLGENPFGHSGRRIGDIYSGLVAEATRPWKKQYRKTAHDHNPVHDALGNAEALLAFRDELDFRVTF